MSKLDVDFRRDFIEALNNIVRKLGQGAKICDCNADDRFIFACGRIVKKRLLTIQTIYSQLFMEK
ncbi:hypothetical protein BSPWISOXPB_6912 [uncultured Gammaproteobacteria bacterium]|nr:hypothetical protein BSPWISOXPB_6912 [uncultured Gammaproteobacteria bacterium]